LKKIEKTEKPKKPKKFEKNKNKKKTFFGKCWDFSRQNSILSGFDERVDFIVSNLQISH